MDAADRLTQAGFRVIAGDRPPADAGRRANTFRAMLVDTAELLGSLSYGTREARVAAEAQIVAIHETLKEEPTCASAS